jgi:hypothetical protein
MRKAIGGYCGDFRSPRQPFVASSFSGEYPTNGPEGEHSGPTPPPGAVPDDHGALEEVEPGQ